MVKTASKQLRICLKIMHVRRMRKVSTFMAVTTKIVTEKAKNGQNGKMLAKIVLKWQGHGTGGISYRCLWVTKSCGRSRTPRTASAPNSLKN